MQRNIRPMHEPMNKNKFKIDQGPKYKKVKRDSEWGKIAVNCIYEKGYIYNIQRTFAIRQ